MTLAELVGERLVIGIPGTKITPMIVRHFQELHAGGLILYRINFVSPAQIKKLVADLEEALGRKLLVAADHEGGRVIMFRDGITVFPDNLAVGTAGKIDYARKQGEIEAKELRRLGLDVNLAPVLDVLTEAYSPNIGIRSYGKDWRLVAELGAARIAAMQKHGLSACAKHFPGKGHAPVDAHLGLPVIQSTWKEMEEVHLKPFVQAIQTGVDLVPKKSPPFPEELFTITLEGSSTLKGSLPATIWKWARFQRSAPSATRGFSRPGRDMIFFWFVMTSRPRKRFTIDFSRLTKANNFPGKNWRRAGNGSRD
jgi:beta-N-acetylhexosaminidase